MINRYLYHVAIITHLQFRYLLVNLFSLISCFPPCLAGYLIGRQITVPRVQKHVPKGKFQGLIAFLKSITRGATSIKLPIFPLVGSIPFQLLLIIYYFSPFSFPRNSSGRISSPLSTLWVQFESHSPWRLKTATP